MVKKQFDDAADLLLMEIFHPSRVERAINTLKIWAWQVSNERGPLNWAGDRLDDIERFYRRKRSKPRRRLRRK